MTCHQRIPSTEPLTDDGDRDAFAAAEAVLRDALPGFSVVEDL